MSLSPVAVCVVVTHCVYPSMDVSVVFLQDRQNTCWSVRLSESSLYLSQELVCLSLATCPFDIFSAALPFLFLILRIHAQSP